MILSFNEVKGGVSAPLTPIMGGAGTTTISELGATSVKVGGTYTSDNGSAITAQGVVVYPTGNASTIIGGSGVLDFADTNLTSPISANVTGLTKDTGYCTKPYATNANGTSYGTELCFTTLSAFVYVSNNGNNQLLQLNDTTLAINATVGIGTAPRGIFYYNGHIYSANFGSGNISKVAVPAMTVVGTLATAAQAANFTRIGDELFVCNRTGQSVTKVNLTTFTVTGSVSTPGRVNDISNDGAFLYVADQSANKVHKINPTTMTIVGGTPATINGCGSVIAINGFIYIGSNTPNYLYKIDPSTMTILSNIAISNYIYNLHYTGGFLYGTIYISNSVVKIDITGGTPVIVATLGGFNAPTYMKSIGTKAYVTNGGNNTMSIIDLNTFTITSTTAALYNSPRGLEINL